VLATVLGLLGGGAAWVLIRLIGLLTNLALFHRVGWNLPNFSTLHRGPLLVVVAAASGLIIGLLAKWCPEIQGHGIPEAMDAVLTNQSRIRPRTALAKPLSAALAIGAGGPFGAEGPIIVTGGALGSLLGQLVPVSPSERKILLACGAAAGMAATFGTPLAAVVLVIELLLFEFSARAFVPLVVSTALAGGVHSAIFGTGPLFAVPAHDYHGLDKLPYFAVLGVLCGLLAVIITRGLFLVEDGYRRLPIGEFWHPFIGAIGFALIGLLEPRALGVGYDVISDVLLGKLTVAALLAIGLAKLTAWWIALASRTSGGTLAPLLLISGAFGSLFGTAVQHVAPGLHISPGGFALVAMAATFGAAIGATFASIVFLFELTRDYQIILPLMLASVVAQAVAGALLRDNLMTEKLTRRNVRVESDYAVDVLASASVRDVMTTDTETLPRDATVGDARRRLEHDGHGAYPIVDDDGRCLAIVAREDVLDVPDGDDGRPALEVASADVVTVAPDQSLVVALRFLLDEGIGHLPVVDDGRLVGMCTRTDILRARQRRFDDDTLQPGFLGVHAAAAEAVPPAMPPVGHAVGRAARRHPAPSLLPSRRVVHHYLIVANQTLGGDALNDAIAERVALGPSRFHVLVPATPAHDLYQNVMNALEGELPDQAAATAGAQKRLEATLESIRASGAAADGEIGDPDPLAAIEAVLERHHFDEIIVSTLPRAVSRWLKLDLPARVGHAFDLPVTHVVAEGRG
jgi:H+/Cl- antiporter ClcA/CBS domain-containing protein